MNTTDRSNGLKRQVTEQNAAGQSTSACDPTMQVCLSGWESGASSRSVRPRGSVQWPAVGGLFGTVAAAVGVFAGTNVDDIIVLTVLFLSARTAGLPRVRQIWVGQYAGIAVLVAASAVAALGLTVIPDTWVGLLGLVPFGLGVKGLIAAIRSRGKVDPPAPAVATGLISVAGVTVANGADNISVYTPMFRTIGLTDSIITVAVFAVGVAIWCLAGSWLGSHKKAIEVVQRYGHWIVPGVFMLIGAVIFIESGVLTRAR
jgi:cadmium resistance protein CadD (predicted permease)